MSIRVFLLALVCAGALAACSASRPPVDPAGNPWPDAPGARPAPRPAGAAGSIGAFGGGAPAQPAAAPASSAAPAR